MSGLAEREADSSEGAQQQPATDVERADNDEAPLIDNAAQPLRNNVKEQKKDCPMICLIASAIVVLLFFLSFIVKSLYIGYAENGGIVYLDEVLTSPNDDRQYSYIQLSNGLQALIISDPDAETAGAAMDVSVGSWSDPNEFRGLAHAVEHCLFLGTVKYPGEAEYNAYLAAHGGASNAYTDLEDTNYYFSVASDGLEGALDRFAQFFIAPTFNESSVLRELQAVDSEHKKNLQSDTWRLYQLMKHVSSPDTPFNSFATGSLDTLNHNGVRAAMIAFHARHYHAKRMKLVVVANYETAVLEQWVLRMFSDVPAAPRDITFDSEGRFIPPEHSILTPTTGIKSTQEAVRLLQSEPAGDMKRAVDMVKAAAYAAQHASDAISPVRVFPHNLRQQCVFYRPVTDRHVISLVFPLPARVSAEFMRVGVERYLANLLGDEGAGSIFSALKNRTLADAITVSMEVDTSGFSLLHCEVRLDSATVDSIRSQDRVTALEFIVARVVDVFVSYVSLASTELRMAINVAHDMLDRSGHDDIATQVVTDAGFLRRVHGDLIDLPGNVSSTAWRVWKEMQTIAEISHRYVDKGIPDDLSSGLARRMQRYGPRDILLSPSRQVWQPQIILDALRQLTTEDMLVFVGSKVVPEQECNQSEPIYGTKWFGKKLTANGTLSETAAALGFPPLNTFIPTSLSLVRHMGYAEQLGLVDVDLLSAQLQSSGQTNAPSLWSAVLGGSRSDLDDRIRLEQATLARDFRLGAMLLPIHDLLAPLGLTAADARSPDPISLWWMPDALFGRPRSFVAVEAVCSIINRSPADVILTSLAVSAFKEFMREKIYAAERVGAKVSLQVSNHVSGLTLMIEAYSDSLPQVYSAVAAALTIEAIREGQAVTDISRFVHSLSNEFMSQPYERALYYHDLLVGHEKFSTFALLQGAYEVVGLPRPDTHSDLRRNMSAFEIPSPATLASKLRQHFLSITSSIANINVLVYGNENVTTARNLGRLVAEGLAKNAWLDTLKQQPSSAPTTVLSEWASETRSLPAERLLLQIAGENPDDVNSATVTAYQGTLRDSCEGRTTSASFAPLNSTSAGAESARFNSRSRKLQGSAHQRTLMPDVFPMPMQDPAGDYHVQQHRASHMSQAPPNKVRMISRKNKSMDALVASIFSFRRAAERGYLRDLAQGARQTTTVMVNQLPGAGGNNAKLDLENCDLRNAAFDMLTQLIKDPAFDVLRTKQQLGYIVRAAGRYSRTFIDTAKTRNISEISFQEGFGYNHAQALSIRNSSQKVYGDYVPSLLLLVQSATKPANDLDDRIAAFMRDFEEFLTSIDEDTWSSAVDGVLASSRRVPISMKEAFLWQWDEISLRSFRTSRRDDEAVALRHVHLAHVLELYRQMVLDARTARVLTVEVFGKGREIVAPAGAAESSVLIRAPV